jgi:hypothetical protein
VFKKNLGSPDKTNPFARRGRKATDLRKMAELPKEEPAAVSAFFFTNSYGEKGGARRRKEPDQRFTKQSD